MVQQRAAYTAGQLALQIGWTERHLNEARRLRIVPEPDVYRPKSTGPRWSADVARALIADRNGLRNKLAAGVLVASEFASVLAHRLDVPVSSDAVAELGRLGYLPVVRDPAPGSVRLYSAWAARDFNDLDALAQAEFSGELHTTDGVATELQVRRPDVDHLTRLGLLRPVKMAGNPRHRSAGAVPLFRHGDLVALLEYDRIDWEAVRSTPRGRRSPLAKLPPADDTARAELERLARGTLHHRLGHRKWGGGDSDAAAECWRAAADYHLAAEHLEDVATGDHTLMLRCAAMIAFQSMATSTT